MDIQEEIKQRGVLEGRKQGMQQGIQQGVQQGRQENMQAVVCNMLKQNLDISLISSVTGLSAEEIEKLQNE